MSKSSFFCNIKSYAFVKIQAQSLSHFDPAAGASEILYIFTGCRAKVCRFTRNDDSDEAFKPQASPMGYLI